LLTAALARQAAAAVGVGMYWPWETASVALQTPSCQRDGVCSATEAEQMF